MADEADGTTWSNGAHHPGTRVKRALVVASVVASLAPAVMATADFAGLRGAWILVTAAALSAAAIVSPLWDVYQRRRNEDLDDRQRLADVLMIDPPPLVADADPYELGVFPSQRAAEAACNDRPPYVRRDIDDALDRSFTPEELARRDGVVVLCGAPGSGLSRTLWEALKRNVGDRTVYALTTPAGNNERRPEFQPIETLLSARLPEPDEPMVLWLDDAHEHLERGLTFGNLRRLRRIYPDMVVAATVHSDQLRGIRRTNRELGRRLESGRVDGAVCPELSAPEVDRARRAYPTLTPDEALERLPAWLEGSDLLRSRYVDARSSKNWQRLAVTRAAVDWHRTGMASAVPWRELRELADIELEQVAPHKQLTDAGFATAVEWATEEEPAGVSLLRRAPEESRDRFQVAEVIVDWATENEDPVSQACWNYILKRAASRTRLRVGYHAYLAGRSDVAQAAWTRATRSHNRDVAPRAQLLLGILHQELDRPDEAERAYQRAAASGHTEAAPRAQLHLGELFAVRGRLDDAEEAYGVAIAGDDPDVADWARMGLAHVLVELQRSEEAIATLQAVTGDSQASAAATAQYDLGKLFRRLGRPTDAEAAFRAAATIGRGSDVARLAKASLHGQLKGLSVDADEATAFSRAVEDNPSDAKLERAAMLADLGRVEKAEGALREVIDGDHPEAKPWGYLSLGGLHEKQGRLGDAEAAFDAAIASGHAEVAPWARYHRAEVLRKQGRQHEAEHVYRAAIAGENPEVAARAQLGLARLLAETGRHDAAVATLRAVILEGRPSVAPDAQLALGKLLTKLEQHDDAARAFAEAIASDVADVAAWAQLNLAELRASQGRTDEAAHAFRRAIASHHKQVVGWAHWGLGCLLRASGLDDKANDEYRRAEASGDPEVAALAKEALDGLRRRRR